MHLIAPSSFWGELYEQDKKEHHFENYRRRHGDIALFSVAVSDLAIDKIEINFSPDFSQNMIGGNALFKVDLMIKELRLKI
ncbi:MAG: hypothetical protein ABFD62_08730, partial [Syntrophaceae bacterium]